MSVQFRRAGPVQTEMAQWVRTLAAVTAVLACIGWPAAAWADHVKDGRAVHRIVVQMNEDNPKLWDLLLNNIGNIINDMGKERVEIKVVAYGPGIYMFKKDRSTVLDRLASLKKFAGKTVEYTVCSNTMKTMKVERQDMTEL